MSFNREALSEAIARLSPGAEVVHVTPLTGGVSADVRRLDLRLNGRRERLVLRACPVPRRNLSIETQFRLLQALHHMGVSVPKPLLYDTIGNASPGSFLLMEFVEGSTDIPAPRLQRRIQVMADQLAQLHDLPTQLLPRLPLRIDPLPELWEYLPANNEWKDLRACLHSLPTTAYDGQPVLLHGDFWPENLIWRQEKILAILDWEDAALGDPLCDVAGCALELRYRFGRQGMRRFIRAYGKHAVIDPHRLALWLIYVAAAGQKFMADWGLAPALERHMRSEALASIREAGAVLLQRPTPRHNGETSVLETRHLQIRNCPSNRTDSKLHLSE